MKKDKNNVYFYTNGNQLYASDFDTKKTYEIKSLYSIYSTSLDSFFIDLISNHVNNPGKTMPIVWFESSIKNQIINRIKNHVTKPIIINIKDESNKYINTKADSDFDTKYKAGINNNSIIYITNNIHLRNEEEKLKKHYKKEFFEYLKNIYIKMKDQKKSIFIISTDDTIFNLKELAEINKFLKKAKEYGHNIICTHKIQKTSPHIENIFESIGDYEYSLFSYVGHSVRDTLSIEKMKENNIKNILKSFKF